MQEPGEITYLLQQADQGNKDAANELFRLVEDELKAIAHRRKQSVPKDVDCSTTVLVDDAFCRLVGNEVTHWHAGDRRKFFSYAATKIHNLLVNTLQAEHAQKRGRDQQCRDGEAVHFAADETGDVQNLDILLDLQTALDEYHAFAETDSIIFRIRYFLNCTFAETAQIMGISVTEAKRSFSRTQLWLRKQLRSYHYDT